MGGVGEEILRFGVRLFWIFSKKNLFFPLKKSLFSFLSVCFGFLEKSFYQKKSILILK
jgi:hypothetical protein